MKRLTIAAALFLALLPVGTFAPMAFAQDAGPRAAPTVQVETGPLPVLDTTPGLDVVAATNGYLSRVSGEARARSDA